MTEKAQECKIRAIRASDWVLMPIAPDRYDTLLKNFGSVLIASMVRNDTLPTLRDRMHGTCFRGVAGNLGYYMTRSLIEATFFWSYCWRYPKYPLPPTYSYTGFTCVNPR